MLSVFLSGLLVACSQPDLPGLPLPGAVPIDSATRSKLAGVWVARGPEEVVRTRHLLDNGAPKYTNRLLLEASPYLRQHAHNPVDWYPWGDEAFATARRLGRPVLVSIGYSTCHWCHVMEEESFEDEEIARVLNERYVAIKVDREQRPDIDSIYMTAVQSMTGRGGWPMTVWLTPDREPFHGGTYFPPRDGDRGRETGFLTLLVSLSDAWVGQDASLAARGVELTARVRRALGPQQGPATTARPPAAVVFRTALGGSLAGFDAVHGGTRGAPKFPSSLPLRALLRLHRRGGDDDALRIVTTTLDGMAAGGIRDHLGGGFHRYSVDAAWGVPHFEKMLYDNALLATVYLEAWQATGKAAYAEVVRDILGWVRREMRAPAGGFYSATDADSPDPSGRRVEGWFYTWTAAETAAILGAESALFDDAYGVTTAGPLEGRSVLHLVAPLAESQVAGLARARAALLAARDRRPRPLRDDKVLTSWNGLMISAVAKAALAFGDDDLRQVAAAAADFVMRDFATTGRLSRTSLGDRSQGDAFVDDYAFLIAGLLDLHEAGDGRRRLDQAIALDRILERDFEDPAGGFFLTSAGTTGLLVREKPVADGAEPSGNSVAILSLLRLEELTGDRRYRDRAERALDVLAPLFARSPRAVGEALVALDFASDAPKEVVLVSGEGRASLAPLLDVVARNFLPNRVLLTVTADSQGTAPLPLEEDKVAVGGTPTAYLCEARVCERPTSDPAVLAKQIQSAKPLPEE
ncbi:MAG: thioredoxin domain-containing protein [Candidatus Binatia bacterium]